MRSSVKAIIGVGLVVGVLAVGVAVIVVGATVVARHVPARSALVIEISGPLPEVGPTSFFGDVLGAKQLGRRDLRDALVKAAADPRVRAVRIRVGDVSAGLATVQEVRSLLARATEAGTLTAAYLDTVGEFAPGNLEYLVASGCRRIVVGPLGDVNLTGLSARVPFIRGTLDKLGIEPEFPGVGDFKTARFFFTERDLTPADREMTTWLLDSLREQLVADIGRARGMAPERVKELIARAPMTADEAKETGLIDDVSDWPTFVESVRGDDGEALEEVSLRRYLRASRPDSKGPTVAVVVVEGAIVLGESGYSPVPLLGGDFAGSETLAGAFRAVRESDAVATVLRIDSPGGSPVASEAIRAEVVRTAERMPVVVSMGDVAASGGYWITCGASRIVADPATLTASIGVYGGHFAMARFWEQRLGVTWGRVEGDPNADIFGSLDPWTPAQRAAADRLLGRVYDAFLDRVAAARGMRREDVNAVGQGRVFTGVQALAKGLVDELGGFDEALAAAKNLAGLDRDASVSLEFYPRYPALWERLVERTEEGTRMKALLETLAQGRVSVPGPVWMPPIAIE